MATPDSATFWNRTAKKYAASRISDMAGYERTLERVKGFLRRSDSVLEIGCGTGTTALRLAPAVNHLVATDLAGEMIAIARDKQASAGIGNITFVEAPAEAPPGDAGAYDAVLAFNVLHLVTDRDATLAQAWRLLKPGGYFFSKTPCLSEMHWLIRRAVPIAQWFGKAPPVDSFDAQALTESTSKAGFTVMETARHGSGKKDPRIFILARKPL